MIGEDLRVFKVMRPEGKWHDPETGTSCVTVVARTEKQALNFAVGKHETLLLDMYDGHVTKEELVVEDITDKLTAGYEIAAE